MKNEEPKSTKQAVDDYFRELAKGSIFSIAGAVEEIRRRMPGCELTSAELAELLASHAVALGFTPISFDRHAIRHRIELAVSCEIAGHPLSSPRPLPAVRPAVVTQAANIQATQEAPIPASNDTTANIGGSSPS